MSSGEWTAILRGEDRSLRAEAWRTLLACAEPAYRGVVVLRNKLYSSNVLRSHDLGRTTISIGNLTTGGTGKTPMVIDLARRLLDKGAAPAVLLRGHMAGPEGSDEARLLAEELGPRVPVEVDPRRVLAAKRVLERRPDIDVFLLDDGFQHRQARRDLDLVLLDALEPFGPGRMLPRGLLREPRPSLARAGAVIITRADQVDARDLRGLDEQVRSLTGKPPLAHVAHRWIGFRDHKDEPHPAGALQRLTVVGVCGIGNPRGFAATLAHHTATPPAMQLFPDHHAYTRGQVETLLLQAKSSGAAAIVTTEKDWVKWKSLLPERPALPIFRPVLRLLFLDGEEATGELLARTLAARQPVPPQDAPA
ncbi:MAG: tetraacyldisaccharide 4'-kinase [Planctomycetota bacterium]|nr:tetraacyldisaccharide 4'-kinase [Planctomycetota bacterium]